MIRISDLHKYYNKGKKNETYALKGIKLEFETTGLVCILGESGCGKTTLLNSIGGLDSVDNGTLHIDDETVSGYHMSQIERIRNDKFGYIFQNYYLLSDQTVEENILIALSMFDISDEEKNERVEYTLQALGITKYKKKKVSNLSGGQQQRVSIARALVKAPEIILADEPTGNLDEENTINTMSILKSISKQCLVILVTHEREMANLFADRIIEMVDGEVKADYANKSKDAYKKGDDQNIYLGEYDKESLENELLSISAYKKSDITPESLKLKLVFKEGKIYIKNETDYNIFIENEESDFSIVEGKAPTYKLDTMDNIEFSMDSIKEKNTNRLPFKQIKQLAKDNRRALGKKQLFMIITVLVATIMLTLVVADYINKRHIDKTSVVTYDSHILEITISATEENKNYNKYVEDKKSYCGDYSTSNKKYKVFPKTNAKGSLAYDEVAQLISTKRKLDNVCVVPISVISKSDILYGRLPESVEEIVIDKVIYEKFKKDNPTIGGLLDGVDSMLDNEINIFAYPGTKKIVGITDLGEPDIFMDECEFRRFRTDELIFASLSELKKEYPGEYDTVVLEERDALMRENLHDSEENEHWSKNRISYGDNYSTYTFFASDDFKDDFYAEVVVSDESYQKLMNGLYSSKSGFYVYVYDKADIDEVAEYFTDIASDKKYKDTIKIEASYRYGEELSKYMAGKRLNINARNIAAMVVFLLSIIVVYFSMKLNISARKEQIIVYRLIGLNPSSIIQSFVMEMGSLTAMICIPVIVITSLVIRLISGIKAIGVSYYFSWSTMFGLAVAMIFANAIVCFLSVAGMLKRPPVRIR